MKHHLVVINSSWIKALIDGRKTVECRLSKRRQPPFGSVQRGDVVWFKLSAGSVVARSRVRRVHCVEIDSPDALTRLARRYGDSIATGPAFFRRYRDARYATLLQLAAVQTLSPFCVSKRDRRGWVVLSDPPISA